ncbi:MAG: ECF transporter S component [Firmicutes bacterium]|nr:ECF transporter S component [Bacillota bacterium]
MNELWIQVKNNLSFLLVCIGVAVAISLLAKLAEKYLPATRKVRPAKRLTILGVSAAISAVLHMLDFPLPFLIPGFYKMDFSELSVLIAGFYLGPSAAVVTEALKIFLKLLMKGTSTAFVGDFANFAVGCTFVVPATILYHLHKSKKSAVAGLAAGTLIMTVFGSAFNALYLIPKFAELFGMPIEAIVGAGNAINSHITGVSSFVLLAVAPMNLIKGTVVSILTLLLYKKIETPLFGKE